MRFGGVLVVVWLIIGAVASYQRGYFSGDTDVNCAEFGTVLLTVVAGPLNYLGVNPQIDCTLPQPSQ
jgi:hypothetical protein